MLKLRSLIQYGSSRRLEVTIPAVVTVVGLLLFALINIGSNDSATSRFIQKLELQSLDARFHLRGPRAHDENIVIVGLDEDTLQQVGSFPIARNIYAQMVDQLAKGGAKVIAFDANFPVPEKNSAVEALKTLESRVSGAPSVTKEIQKMELTADNDAILAESFKRAGNVVLGHLFLDPIRAKSVTNQGREEYLNILSRRPFPQIQKVSKGKDFEKDSAFEAAHGQVARGVYANIRTLAESAKSYGFFDDEADADGTFRRATLLILYAGSDFFPSLAVQTVREFEDIKDQDVVAYIAETGFERMELGRHTLHIQGDGHALINFVGPYLSYKHYSMIDVVKGIVPPETFKGKIVIFGATAVAIGDIRNIPFPDPGYMGVEIHANIVDNILHSGESGRGFLSRGINEESIDVFFILLFGAGLGYWFLHSKPSTATASAVAALFIFAAVVYLAFAYLGMWLSFVVPTGTLIANYAGITSFRMIFEEREKQRVRNTFKRYVSPGVISLIEKDPQRYFKPGGESKDLTVMFSDIRSFTSLSEGLTPDELVTLLNEYLGEMTDIIFKHWGTLDKYIGDAVMGFWGSPFPAKDHAVRGCAAALEMHARLHELNQKWVADGGQALAAGIGLNTGIVNVGNMGSAKRFAWTVMGDNVNLASRLEGASKEYRVSIIVGRGTFEEAKTQYVFRELDRICVKGKVQPIQIYELLDHIANQDKHNERIALWSKALGFYLRGEWEHGIRAFEAVLERYPDDGPSSVFLHRCEEKMTEAPVADWDGVWVMKSK